MQDQRMALIADLRALEADREANNREWIAGDISYDSWLEMSRAIAAARRATEDELDALSLAATRTGGAR